MKKILKFMTLLLSSVIFYSCSDLIKDSLKNSVPESEEFGSISISSIQSGDRSASQDVAFASIYVTGKGIVEGSLNQPKKEFVKVVNGAVEDAVVERIPSGVNRVVVVYPYDSKKELLSDQILMAVTDVKRGEKVSVTINKGTTALGRVYSLLNRKGVDVSALSSKAVNLLKATVDTTVAPSRVNTVKIADDYVSGGYTNLNSKSTYVSAVELSDFGGISYDIPKYVKSGEILTVTLSSEYAVSDSILTLNGVSKPLKSGKNSFNVSDFVSGSGVYEISGIVKNEIETVPLKALITVSDGFKPVKVTNQNQLRIYQVMVSSFIDGNPKIGYREAYGPSTSNNYENKDASPTTTGGDLQGIIDAAEYIQSLGVNAIWMTPVFSSTTGDSKSDSTGYYAYDYFKIDEKFGTNQLFKELVDKYHSLGINVILDGVFGHHQGTVNKSPSDDPYVLYPGLVPNLETPVEYPGEGNCTLNYYSDVAQYWIRKYKIDGWRFDQCYQVGLGEDGNGSRARTGGHNYWYDIRKVVENASSSNGNINSDWGTLGYMVGEHWSGASEIQKGSVNPGNASGYGLRSCFDFPDRYNIVNSLAEAEWDAGGNQLGWAMSQVYRTPDQKGYYHPDGFAPNLFVTNHDMVRFGNLLNWDEGLTPENERYWQMHKLMLACMMAYTGPVTIYYGDEWGAFVPGITTKPHDGIGYVGNNAYYENASRSSGKIDGFSSRELDLINYTQKLLRMREKYEALWNGDYQTISANGELYVGKKSKNGQQIIFALNNQSSSQTFSATGTDLLTGEKVSGNARVEGYSARFILCN